jgi:broad specificity phosphatase PhoE
MLNSQVWTKRLALASTALVLIATIIAVLSFWLRSTTVVLVIRHAERNDAGSCVPPTVHGHANPPLSLVGGQSPRAQTLVHVCGKDGIAAIYASEFCRTQQTVEPLANQLGLPINLVNQFANDGSVNVDDLVARVWTNNRGQVVLIVGHTNTIPAIIQGLSGVTIAPIEESEFDNLFVVTIPRWFGNPKVVRLKYGEPT